MNKNILWLVIAVVLLGGYGWYQSSDRSKSGIGQDSDQTGGDSLEGVGAFASLFEKGSVKCEVGYQNDQGNSTGTVYVASQDKIRADFATQFNGQTYQSHMIQRDGYAYTWMDGTGQGYKMMIQETSQTQTQKDRAYVDPNTDVNYDCDSWSVDESQFETPRSVTFTEFDVNLKGAGSTEGGASGAGSTGDDTTKTQACAACSQVGDAASQTACRQALGCN